VLADWQCGQRIRLLLAERGDLGNGQAPGNVARHLTEPVALLRLDNEDRADARAQTVQLAQAGSRISWGAPVVSTIVLVTFGIVLYRVLSQPTGAIDQNATLMLGALTTMASAVVSYWVGSSAGSAAKDKLLRK